MSEHDPRMKDTPGRDYARVEFCKNCGAVGSLIRQRVTDQQTDLFGRKSNVYTRLRRPMCRKCGHVVETPGKT